MDYKLIFCNDGILRAKYSNNKPLIPVNFIQKDCKLEDLQFWCNWWENNVEFEGGLTVAKFLSCLEPWKDFWSIITGKNIAEYIKESRKPILINKDNKEEEDKLSWIGISYYSEASPDIKYKKTDHDDDLEKWLNSPKERKLTGTWNMHSSYRVTGFKDGENEQYSIEYTPLCNIANTPIILTNYQYLYFSDYYIEKISEKKLFNEESFGVCSVDNGKIKYLLGRKEHRMRDVVEGFFWWMYKNPSRREDFVSDILDSKEIAEEMVSENKEKSNDSEKEIKIVPGAFSSIIEYHKEEKEYFDYLLDKAKNEKNSILKIGKVQEVEKVNKRIFGYEIDPKDKNANPKETNFKKD